MTRFAGLALGLLLVGVAAQFLWQLFPGGQVWNASQALLCVALLALVANAYPARSVRLVCALLAVWQSMTAGCSIAYLIRPWPIEPGQGQCSAALNLPLGAISGCVALVLAWRLYVRGRDG